MNGSLEINRTRIGDLWHRPPFIWTPRDGFYRAGIFLQWGNHNSPALGVTGDERLRQRDSSIRAAEACRILLSLNPCFNQPNSWQSRAAQQGGDQTGPRRSLPESCSFMTSHKRDGSPLSARSLQATGHATPGHARPWRMHCGLSKCWRGEARRCVAGCGGGGRLT